MRTGGAVALTALLTLLSACREPEIDAEKDPVKKAQIMCRHTIEETRLSDPDQRDADGVLRKRVGTFAEPVVTQEGDKVRFTWAAGAIVDDRSGARHGAECLVDPARRHVYEATFDGQPMQSNYGY